MGESFIVAIPCREHILTRYWIEVGHACKFRRDGGMEADSSRFRPFAILAFLR